MNNKLIEIQNLLDTADYAYYTDGRAIFEDAKYDKLKEELKFLNPNDSRLVSVGASLRDSILHKKNHSIPMGSLDKESNKEEWLSWLKNNGLGNETFHVSPKMDGGSLSLNFVDGRLISAISRGDGNVGEDIAANALNFKNIPKIILINGNKLFNGFVRGEIILLNNDWKIIDPNNDSNPRNLAVGISRRKDGSQSEYLSFYAFRMFDFKGNPIEKTETLISETMKKCGFDIAPFISGNVNDVWKFFENIYEKRQSLDYWADGVVVKLDDITTQLSLGESSNRPRAQIAIKFEAEGETTILREVTLQVGNSGVICPVAHFDSIRIGGTTVSCATLCNWENIETLGVCIGDKINVIKAGDIIPRIMEVVEEGKPRESIPRPTKCPVCNSELSHRDNISGEESTAIYCLNTSGCPAIICGRIDKYLTSLDILGIGTNLIESLIKDLGVKDPSDLYLLHNKRNEVADIILSGKVRLGEKRADKFLEEIEKKRTLTLSDFLGSLGIFGLGKRRVVLIQENLGDGSLDNLENWFTDTLIKNADKAGVKNMAKGINNDLINQKNYIMKFIKNGVIIEKQQKKKENNKNMNNNVTVCITGKLSSPKKYYQELIEKKGYSYTDTFSNDVTYLVAADINSGSSKLKKAQKNGISILNEDELLELLEK